MNGEALGWWRDDDYSTYAPWNGEAVVPASSPPSSNSLGETAAGKLPVVHGTSYKRCPGHDGLTVVHAYPDGTTLSGASRYELNRYGVDLLIDCGVDVSNNGFVKGCPAGFEKLKSFGVVPNVLKLDWPDRGAPPVGLDFWRELRRLFQGGWNVVACCLGGHGRTGTCLAALLIEDGMSAKDAIGQVRTVHCVDAVESKAQEMYLEWLGNEAAREGG